MEKKLKLLFTGGGTGGHIMPIIAIARELRKIYQQDNLELYYLGPKDKGVRLLLQQEGMKVYMVASGKIRRYFSFQNIIDIFWNIPVSFIQSFFLLFYINPKLVFSKGGTGSLPVTFCARLLWMPVFVHESDIIPGLSNKITYGFAKKTFVSFENTEYFNRSKTIVVGNPIRTELLEGNKEAAKETLKLTLEKPVVLFYGGSQGALIINAFVLVILNELVSQYEVIHVSGAKNYKQTLIEAKANLNKGLEKYYHLYESLNELQLQAAYAASSLIVSRAGSGSIFEIAALGKPSILIPLSGAAKDHQSKNAYEYGKTGATLILEEGNLTPNFFLGEIDYLISHPGKVEKIKAAAQQFAKPLAAQEIAKQILEYVHAY